MKLDGFLHDEVTVILSVSNLTVTDGLETTRLYLQTGWPTTLSHDY